MKYFIFLFFISSLGSAKVVYFGSEPEVIPVAYGGPTLFRFPLEVRTISQAERFQITPSDPDQPNYALLSVTPRFTSGLNNVTFILNDGTVIRTRLVSQKNSDKADGIYEFRSKDSLLPSKENSSLSEMDLMKALIRGDEVSGYDVKATSKNVSLSFSGVSTTLIRKYVGSNLTGYIFELKNLTDSPVSIRVQNLVMGNPNQAVLSNIEPAVIFPEKSGNNRALLRVVAKATSSYDDLILPIQGKEKK